MATSNEKIVPAGSSWTVDRVTRLGRLTVGDRTKLLSPAGSDLTLTVDGVETPLLPGTYRGDVVLTPTRVFPIKFVGFGDIPEYHFRNAVTISDGQFVPEQSVIAAVQRGRVDNHQATSVHITSRNDDFNGIVVTGRSDFTINDPVIDLTGYGGNDFVGFGAGIMSAGTARVTVNNARIRTKGAIRTSIFVGGDSTMVVNNADIETFSGALPAGYVASVDPGKMFEVPFGLGISGNVRATNLMDHGTVYYNNSHIKAHGWGALSSDLGGPTRMFVTDSLIETEGSGYGAYATGDAHDYFRHTTINAPDLGGVIAGPGWITLTDASVINSGKIGIMMHQGSGGSLVTLERKSRISSANTAIQIKGRGGDVLIDDGMLAAGNGVLIQTMENDDPYVVAMRAKGGPAPGDTESLKFSPDVHVTFRNTSLTGDVLHAMIERADMTITLANAALVGAISESVAKPASGLAPTEATFRTIGDVVNSLEPSQSSHGVTVYLQRGSRWTVAKTSYLRGLTIADGAKIEGPTGQGLRMIVNGTPVSIVSGVYVGKIILQVG